jgi:hypothetical protein
MLKTGSSEERTTFVRKSKRVNTWGVAVKEGQEIKKGAEIFVDYGIHYTWDDQIE